MGDRVRIVFYEFAVINFIRIGIWQGLGIDPIFMMLDALDRAFATSPITTETNLGQLYLTVSAVLVLISFAIVIGLSKHWSWGLATIVISFLAGWGIGAANVPFALLVVPSMLLGIYAPLMQNQQRNSRPPPPV